MKKILVFLLAFGVTAAALAATSVTNDLTFLDNSETLDNTTDAELRATFNDDGVTIGKLVLESDNAEGNMADGDSMLIQLKANTADGAKKVYAYIDLEIDDVTSATLDGSIGFNILIASNNVEILNLNAQGLILRNGEIVGNNTDADIDVVFDDDAATLGEFRLKSSNAGGNMSDEDGIEIVFEAADDSGDETDYAKIKLRAADVSDGVEDGKIVFSLLDDNTEKDKLVVDEDTVTITNAILDAAGGLKVNGISGLTTNFFVLVDISGVTKTNRVSFTNGLLTTSIQQ